MPKQDDIIQQVKHIKVPKDDGILSTDELIEERDKLSMKNCKQYCTITLPIFPGPRRDSISSETRFCMTKV